MSKCIWLAFTAIFLVFAVYHLYRATKSLPKSPNTAEAKSISGVNLGIHEFIEGFNLYIDEVNKDARMANVITGLAHFAAATTALLSYFVAP